MGSKGSAAKTETSQTQQYKAHPKVEQAGTQSLDMAMNAANSPFAIPQAPVAGFNNFQQQAFGQVQNMQGQWQPYADAARSYYNQSAAPITGADVSQYYNPMAANIFAQLGNQQQQQMHDVTGRLTGAAGGVGAERVALGQSKLANQQALAYGQTAAGLWQQALGSAQQQKQMAANAGAGMLQTGNYGQTAATRDIATLGQAGLQQQQQSQAELNSPYQQQLAQAAYPFQTAQYLAGITGGVSGALGGKTSGTSSTTQTPAQPSALNQAIGLGTSALGMFMGMPPGMGAAVGAGVGSMFGGGGGGGGFGSTGYVAPYGSPGFPMPFAEGGAIGGGGIWETTKGSVPSIKMQPSAGPKAMTIAHRPTLGQDTSNATSAASKAMGQIGGMFKANGDDYEPDMAEGVAVFPKHFYSGGVTTWEDLSVSPGNPGIPGIDFALPRPNDGNVYMDAPKAAPDMADWGGSPKPVEPMVEPGMFAAGAAQSSAPASAGLTPVSAPEPALPAPKSKAPHEYVRGWLGMDGAAPAPAAPDEMKGNPADYESPPRRWPALPAPEGPLALPAPAQPDVPMPTARPEAAGPSGSIVERTANAIRGNEGNMPYDQFHPGPARNGSRAIGPYGIMPENVPSWTKEALGKPMSIQEFMASPKAQERTAKFKLEQYIKETGSPERAALKWFTGTANPDPDRNDGYNTASWYLKNFRERFNGEKGSGPDEASSIPRRSSSYDQGRYTLPTARQPYPDALQRDWGQQMTRSPWMSLVKAGSTIASTPGPLGVAVGKGIGAGVDHLTGERGIRQKEEGINQRAQQLHQQAQQHLDQYDKMTPYQRESLQQRDDALAKTIYPGKGTIDGQPVDGYYQYDPATREYKFNAGQITGKGGAGGKNPAMVQTAEWMVQNGIAKTPQEAFDKLKTGVRDSVSKGRLLLDIEKAMAEREPALARQPEVLKQRAQEKLKDFLNQAGGAAAAMTPEQTAAKAWVAANPTDPRAAAIREKLKAEGIE